MIHLSNLEDEFSKKNTMNLTKDYAYDPEEDGEFDDVSLAGRDEVIIYGNNHTIDLGNHSTLFDISSSNLIINNLVIKNFLEGAILAENSTITSSNVTYISPDSNQ